ncbi:helix-turn-helix domain-containing protein [Pseudomonas bohemica]|uniref:helix-turn-helix domain-containing protein n=1 Tax=Pseudomonas bohemica TaxID=2044872 RepID=UPI003899C2D7
MRVLIINLDENAVSKCRNLKIMLNKNLSSPMGSLMPGKAVNRGHCKSMQETEHKRKRASRTTPRESEVLRLVLLGYTNKDIAQHLGISDYTARDHVSALLKKNEVKNRAQLVALHVALPRKRKPRLPPTSDGLYR